MPSSDSILHRRYRSALMLNNIAVKLLERNRCGRAGKALRDALHLMDSLANPATCTTGSSTGDRQDAPSHHHGGEAYVKRAIKNLNEIEKSKSTVLAFEVLTITQDGSLEHGGGAATQKNSLREVSCLESLLQIVPSSSVAFLISINEDLLADSQTTFFDIDDLRTGMDQQRAIFIYNLGVAFQCQYRAGVAREGRPRQRILRKSQSLLEGAYSALEQTAEVAAGVLREEECELNARLRIHPLLMIAFLNSLLHTLRASSQPERARHFYGVMVEFRSIALDMMEQSRSPDATTARSRRRAVAPAA